LKGDLKKDLRDFLKTVSDEEIDASLYPNQEPRQGKKGILITEKKIDAFIKAKGVAKTAEILGVSQGRVSQLRGDMRKWLIAAGKREKLLAAMEKLRSRTGRRKKKRAG
jgi:hypothetical protein